MTAVIYATVKTATIAAFATATIAKSAHPIVINAMKLFAWAVAGSAHNVRNSSARIV